MISAFITYVTNFTFILIISDKTQFQKLLSVLEKDGSSSFVKTRSLSAKCQKGTAVYGFHLMVGITKVIAIKMKRNNSFFFSQRIINWKPPSLGELTPIIS